MQTITPQNCYNFLDPETRNDPYPLYKRLRQEDPVHWCEDLQGWLVTRYEDCERLLQDPAVSTGEGLGAMFRPLAKELQREFEPLRRHIEVGMGSLDPPEHTRIRTPMNRGFIPRLIRDQRGFIQALTDEFIDDFYSDGQFEAVTDIAYMLPAIVIANLLGTGRENQHLFLKCSDALGDLMGATSASVDVLRAAQANVLALSDHLSELIEQRLEQGEIKEDLLSLVLDQQPGLEPLNHEEIIANCVELLFAGHLTITTMIGTCLYTLLTHNDAMRAIAENPALTPKAIEEILRYDGPIQMVRRSAIKDFELNGKRIQTGQMVWAVLGSANRDESRFHNPDKLDVHRDGNRHLGFGVGAHYCIGAALARLEGEIVLNTLIRRLPNMRIAMDTLEWWELPAVRSLKSLPVRFK